MKYLKTFNEKLKGDEPYEEKDIQRISDIIKKSDGDKEKQIQLATLMANKITDVEKAERRGNAAEKKKRPELANIFFKRMRVLKRSKK
jgi:predicted transcriptional regulator